VATKSQLRFALARTLALSDREKAKLAGAHPQHVTRDGEFLVTSDETRSLEMNKQIALDRLCLWLRDACRRERARIATRPSRGAKQRRLDAKKARGKLKASRNARYD
jgi:ribosome-associated protein